MGKKSSRNVISNLYLCERNWNRAASVSSLSIRAATLRGSGSGKVAEVIHEPPDEIGNPLTEGEQLFELIENEHRRERVVLRTPEFKTSAMQVLPERLIVVRQQRIRRFA